MNKDSGLMDTFVKKKENFKKLPKVKSSDIYNIGLMLKFTLIYKKIPYNMISAFLFNIEDDKISISKLQKILKR